jgi:nitrogenase-associated protein
VAIVEFWEKPGCAGNARQKAFLIASGHTVIPHDLLTEPWTSETLLSFFAGKDVAWRFNRNATRVKSGEVRPETLDEMSAMALLLADPLLIRRPLMRVGSRCACGFDSAEIAAWIGLAAEGGAVDESCQKTTGHCVV